MGKIGVIVDGAGDLLSIKKRFAAHKVLKTDGPRGHCAIPKEIVMKSKKQLAMLKAFNCIKAVILLDFEDRPISYEEFVKELENELTHQNFGISTEIIVVNKMIENWYLADIEHLSKKKIYIKDNCAQKNYEGKHGKNELKKLFKNNYNYSETEHGPELFQLIREDVAVKNSESFKKFVEKLNQRQSD